MEKENKKEETGKKKAYLKPSIGIIKMDGDCSILAASRFTGKFDNVDNVSEGDALDEAGKNNLGQPIEGEAY
jgi:hypothetical protein